MKEGRKYKQIEDYPDYWIGDNGVIVSMARNRSIVLKTRLNQVGYYVACLRKDKKKHHISVHRLVLEAFVGKRPEGCQCRHLDGDKLNNNLSNLCWGTPKENGEDNVRLGVMPIGENNGNSRLCEQQVLDIRELYATGNYVYRQLAEAYNVTITAICEIVKRRKWKHI